MNNTKVRYYEYFDNARKCNAVKAVTTYAGKYVTAVSYTHPDDKYDVEMGKKIAKARLDIKIAQKRATSMKRRAERYSALIVAYKDAIVKMKKEVDRALSIEGDRLVDVSEAEKTLATLLESVK